MRRRVRLGDRSARCASSTIAFCASGEKPMNVGRAKWLVPPNFRKSGPLSRYALIAPSQLLGRHVHQLLARALRDDVVHLLLEQREPLLADQAEADRVRSAPADDVSGGEDPGADRPRRARCVAHLDERGQRAVAVAHRRDAVLELDLRRFEDDLLLPRRDI